jgi:hypothetical protein
VQIYFSLIKACLAEHVLDVTLLDRSILQSDHSGLFVDLQIEGIFVQHPDKLAPHKFRNLKLDDPRISDKYPKKLTNSLNVTTSTEGSRRYPREAIGFIEHIR